MTIIEWIKGIWFVIKIWEYYNKAKSFFSWKKIENTKIMFIDNELSKFKLPDILKRSGYCITTMQDVGNVDDRNLEKIDIFFIDINWVWRKLRCTNWIDLAHLLKRKFKKSIFCVYSSNYNPSLNWSLDGLYSIKKEPDPELFFKKIDEFIALLNK